MLPSHAVSIFLTVPVTATFLPSSNAAAPVVSTSLNNSDVIVISTVLVTSPIVTLTVIVSSVSSSNGVIVNVFFVASHANVVAPVATVTSNGIVRGVSKGTAQIKVTSSNGKVGKCDITVQ